ncbi:MAG: efflux RND transporter permease subunit, partial [Chlamydiota bacterium]|nr:efflux RND transporter permease subunit [Chlamydiota bacterium]
AGNFVPLSSVSDIRYDSGFTAILRENQQKVIYVSADADTDIITSKEAENMIRPKVEELLKRYPGVTLKFAGESEDTDKSLESMKSAAIIAIALIFIILSGILRSFIQPFLVMSVVPFGIVAVAMGMIFTQQPVGLMAIMGTIALAGIIVNDSLVMVTFINEYRNRMKGQSRFTRWKSLLESGQVRFRPIMLTTVTTVGGLWSLAFLVSGQEKFLSPMAVAIIFGLMFGTIITLVIVPCLISVLDDMQLFIRKTLRLIK